MCEISNLKSDLGDLGIKFVYIDSLFLPQHSLEHNTFATSVCSSCGKHQEILINT